MKINIQLIDKNHSNKPKLPQYATIGSAGMDLYACIEDSVTIKAGQVLAIPTGVAIQIPSKEVGAFIFPRSGLSSKHGISLINSVGVIDSDYTGEIICPLINHSNREYVIQPGDRIAQIVLMPVILAKLNIVDKLDETQRGNGGFGSTGV